MRFLAILAGVSLVGYFAFDRLGGREMLPPPTPPPPPELSQLPPPVLDQAALNRVRRSTQDSDPNVRWEAAQTLVAAHDPRADNILFSMLRQDSDSTIRRNIAGLFSNRKEPHVVGALVSALRDSDAEVRLAVLQSLGQIGDVQSASAISETLHDTDERVRLAALQTLNQLQAHRDQQIQEVKQTHAQKMAEWEMKMREYETKYGKGGR